MIVTGRNNQVNTDAEFRGTEAANEQAETVSHCWNCADTEYEALFTAQDFDTANVDFPIRRCRHCGLCYTANVTDAVLDAAYSNAYYGSGQQKFLGLIEALVESGHRRQAQKILEVYRQPCSADTPGAAVSVLDIGCGRALLLQAFARLGADCLGIERGEFPGAGPAGIDLHVGALQDPELSARRFDIIILWHVLEHITELGILLEELPRHIDPGGLLVISVPNFSSWQSRFFGKYWFHLDIPRHVAHFEKPWLEARLDAMGFEIIGANTLTPSQNLYGFLQSGLNRLFKRHQNRLYRLLTGRRRGRDWLALLGWSLAAAPLLPLALLESWLSETRGQGAALTLYARYEGPGESG